MSEQVYEVVKGFSTRKGKTGKAEQRWEVGDTVKASELKPKDRDWLIGKGCLREVSDE